MSIPEEHVANCGHVLSARLESVLNVIQGYLEADESTEHRTIDPLARQFLDQYMGIGREALASFWESWDSPSVEQIVQASEFVLRRREG